MTFVRRTAASCGFRRVLTGKARSPPQGRQQGDDLAIRRRLRRKALAHAGVLSFKRDDEIHDFRLERWCS